MDFQTDLFSQDHNEPVKSPSTHQLVKQLKDAGEDFEWYPTTTEQLNVVAEHISNIFEDYDVTSRYGQNIRLLDIGAGSGWRGYAEEQERGEPHRTESEPHKSSQDAYDERENSQQKGLPDENVGGHPE